MSIRVGEVIAVHGTKLVLKIDEQSSKETLFYEGERYKGVSIREYLSIQRGFRDIICIVEGEYLDESRTEMHDGRQTFVRKVEARPIGYFDRSGFTQGADSTTLGHSAHDHLDTRSTLTWTSDPRPLGQAVGAQRRRFALLV